MGGGWWISDILSNPSINGQVWVVSWAVWVIFSICLHELAHGWVAIKLGDDTPRLAGHMTWNPLVHMGPYSLLMFVVIGIAWGAMPINPSRLRGKYAEAMVALAGPLTNLGLAIIGLTALLLWMPLCEGMLIPSVTIGYPLSENLALGIFIIFFIFIGTYMFAVADIVIDSASSLFWDIFFPGLDA